jgi:autotransporter-associated beta strand protein
MQSGTIFTQNQGGARGIRNSWKKMAGRSAMLVAATASAGLISQTAHGVTGAWSAAGSGNWATGTNWSTTPNAPGASGTTTNGDTAVFSNGISPTITVDSNRNIDNINFNTSALSYTLSGGSFLLTSGGTLQIDSSASATARTETVSTPITLEGNYTIANNATNSGSSILNVGGTITSAATSGTTTLTIAGTNSQGGTASGTIGGAISNGGGTNVVGINMAATGLWILGGINTYTGLTNVSSGTLQLGPTATSTSVYNYGPVNIASGAVVEENPGSGSVGTPVVTIGSLSGAGTFEYLNSLSGVANFNISESTSTTFSGIFQDTNTANGNFVLIGKNGPGTLTLNGATGSLVLQRGMNVNAGGLTLSGNSTLVTVPTKGATGRDLFSVGQNANITLDDTGTNVTSRLSALDDSITLNGGSFNLLGNSAAQTNEVIQAFVNSSGGVSSVKEGLIFGPGADVVNVTAGTGQYALLVINGLTTTGYTGYGRLAASSPVFQGSQLGTSTSGATVSSIRFQNAAPTITGSGASLGILPGIVVNTVGTGGSNTYGLATYGSAGVVALTAGTNNTGSLTAGTNVDATTALINTNITINSLQLDGAGSISNDPGTLNISSGTILSTGANVSIGLGGGSTLKDTSTTGTTTATGGTLATELVIYNAPASNLSIGATIVSPLGLTKGGAGTTILSADNSASLVNGSSGVPITINGGVLSISAANNLGSPLNPINLNNFGELSSTGASVTLGSGSITLGGTNIAYLSGGLLDVSGASTNVLNQGTGLLVGTGSLTKTGVGILSLTAANTYTGGTNISNGELSLTAAQGTTSGPLGGGTASLPSGQITFGGGSLQYTSTNTTDYSKVFNTSAGQLYSIDTNGQAVTFATALTSSGGSLTKLGAGTLTLSANSTYSGGTTVNGGTLSVTSAGSLASGSALTLGASGAATLAYTNPTFGAVSNTNTTASALNFSAVTGTATLASLSGAGNTNFASNATVGGNFSSGTATVAGVATFTNVSGGTLNLNGATASINTLNGGSINLGTTALTVTAGGTSAGSITGANGSLNVSGGTLNLSGTNTYGGATLINGASLVAGSTSALSPNSAVTVSTGTLDTGGFNNSIASLTVGAAGTLNLSFGSTLTVTGAATLAPTGTLNIAGTGSAGEILLKYASYSGPLTLGSATIPTGTQLVYKPTDLEIDAVVTGPATLTWSNFANTGTWNTTDANWNNGTGNIAYTDSYSGGAGDKVTFDDSISANPASYNVTINNGGASVNPTSVLFNASGNYNVSGSGVGIAGPGSVTLTGTGTVTMNATNTYTGGTNVSAGTLVIAGANAFPNNGSNGTALTVGSSGVFQIAAHTAGGTSTVPVVNSLTNNGVIDVTNNAIQFPGISLGTIYAQVLAAHHADGSWATTGSGLITSSTVSGLTTVGVATVSGVTEVKATYYGDALLTGSVTSADYTQIDSGFLAGATGWQNGDFNYDGLINGSDYTLIDNAFNTQGAQLLAEVASPTAQIAGSGTTSAVPEPASLGLLGIGVLGLLGRRNRARR